jgi:hypothetical protein
MFLVSKEVKGQNFWLVGVACFNWSVQFSWALNKILVKEVNKSGVNLVSSFEVSFPSVKPYIRFYVP